MAGRRKTAGGLTIPKGPARGAPAPPPVPPAPRVIGPQAPRTQKGMRSMPLRSAPGTPEPPSDTTSYYWQGAETEVTPPAPEPPPAPRQHVVQPRTIGATAPRKPHGKVSNRHWYFGEK